MISQDILARLVPKEFPKDTPPDVLMILEMPIQIDNHTRLIALWSALLRQGIQRRIAEDSSFKKLVECSGFIGVGIFNVSHLPEPQDYKGFPVVSGYQFGAVLFRGDDLADAVKHEQPYISSVSLDLGRHEAPVVHALASLTPHNFGRTAGYVAAIFHNANGETCGITAGHVVNKFRPGKKVPIKCSDCKRQAVLKRLAPGLIDAATVVFPCKGPTSRHHCKELVSSHRSSALRNALEGETLEAHFGDSGKRICTVMMSLSTASQIKCAATPKHFLTDIHGHPGDSGSLMSGVSTSSADRDLIGMYLGEADCETGHQTVAYGYSIDLKQISTLLGAYNLKGEFNV